MNPTSPAPAERQDDAELARAFSLTERLMAAPGDGTAPPAPPQAAARAQGSAVARALGCLRHWLWRASGRKRFGGDLAQLAGNYEREIARLTDALRREGDKALARERHKVAELQRLTAQLQKAYEAKLDNLRRRQDERPSPDGAERDRALARAAQAEERARLAENKVEMLTEALEITRARAGAVGQGASAPDPRFREAKRAFARAFHPDQGGRNDAERQRMFLEFWPVLERIERGE